VTEIIYSGDQTVKHYELFCLPGMDVTKNISCWHLVLSAFFSRNLVASFVHSAVI